MISKIVPKNLKQMHYVNLLNAQSPPIVIASGVAGSGKTLLATAVGVEKLISGSVNKIILTRPTVPVGDDIGFLPGNLNKKMEPWIRPLHDALSRYYSKQKISKLIEDNIIEIVPLTYMRGRTFDKSWIICDESQNLTIEQTLMVLTRIGFESKLVITGDPMQHDRGFSNGLVDLVSRISLSDNPDFFQYIEFDENDVQRHPVISHVIKMYK
jgi:phosphate starvation-inducible PhoH-like protein